MVFNLSIADYGLPMRTLTLFSVDEIWLPSYVDWSTNFKDLSSNGEMAPSELRLFESNIRTALISPRANLSWFFFEISQIELRASTNVIGIN